MFTSAGNPKMFTSALKAAGIKVVHILSSSKFAQKAEAAGCDPVKWKRRNNEYYFDTRSKRKSIYTSKLQLVALQQSGKCLQQLF